MIERFPDIVARLEAMLERFMTALDCVDTAFISDQTLDQLPLPAQVGKTRVGGVDMNRPRTRTALAAVLALASSPTGFTVAELTTKARAMTGQTASEYTIRQATYDLKKLRGKHLITRLGRTRRYQVRPTAIRAIAALFILRDHVIAPILAGVRSPPPRSQTGHVDCRRPTLRTTSHPNAAPVSRAGYRGLDNSLSLHLCQAVKPLAARKELPVDPPAALSARPLCANPPGAALLAASALE